jgi:hypothetical protein
MDADLPPKWYASRPLLWAIPLAVAIALAGTGGLIFREDVRLLYETNGDINEILSDAAQASPGSIIDWWTGSWIQHGSTYYRPLASMLFYGEYLAFGRAWRPFCIVSWLMHAGVCVLVLLLMARLFNRWPAHRRLWPGLLAVAWFSLPCETSVDGPHWGNRGIARGVMPYWPAQTDVGCLLFSLLALLLFDRWLAGSRRRTLIGAVLSFVAALLFKEHAVIVPLLAVMLAIYRKRPLTSVALVGGIGLAAAGLFLLLRGCLAPGAWAPHFKGPGHVLFKLGVYFCEPAVAALTNDLAWVVVSSVLLAACLGLAIYRPRWAYAYAVGAFVALFLPPQLMAGNIALPTLPEFAFWLGRVTMTLALLPLIWEQRHRGPALILAGCLLIVHLPVLHVFGPHYYYWPVAWWSMLNATVIAGLGGTAKAMAQRAAPASIEATSDDSAADDGA